MSIKEWFVNAWTKGSTAISKFFEGPGGVVVRQALAGMIQQVGAIGMSMLLDAAHAQVNQLQKTQMTNDSKRIQAVDYLKGFAIEQGINAGESVLRYTVETAVAAMKAPK